MAYTDTHIDNRPDCMQLTNNNPDCIQMKSEPNGASSPDSSAADTSTGGPDDCAACGRIIQVRHTHMYIVYDHFLIDSIKLVITWNESWFNTMCYLWHFHSISAGSICVLGRGETMACSMPSVLRMSTAIGTRNVMLFTWWKHLL